jgi:hypothetical protein
VGLSNTATSVDDVRNPLRGHFVPRHQKAFAEPDFQRSSSLPSAPFEGSKLRKFEVERSDGPNSRYNPVGIVRKRAPTRRT